MKTLCSNKRKEKRRKKTQQDENVSFIESKEETELCHHSFSANEFHLSLTNRSFSSNFVDAQIDQRWHNLYSLLRWQKKWKSKGICPKKTLNNINDSNMIKMFAEDFMFLCYDAFGFLMFSLVFLIEEFAILRNISKAQLLFVFLFLPSNSRRVCVWWRDPFQTCRWTVDQYKCTLPCSSSSSSFSRSRLINRNDENVRNDRWYSSLDVALILKQTCTQIYPEHRIDP